MEVDEEVYILFLNKRAGSDKESEEKRKARKRDGLVQIRFSEQKLNLRCSYWTSNFNEISLFLKNNNKVSSDLPTIQEYFDASLMIKVNIEIRRISQYLVGKVKRGWN